MLAKHYVETRTFKTPLYVVSKNVKRATPKIKQTPSQILLEVIRNDGDYSLEELARAVNLPITTVRSLLLGITKDPHISTFNKIFKTYCSVLCRK